MFVTVAAVLCKLIAPTNEIPPPGECSSGELINEVVVTDTNLEPSLDSIQSCLIHSQIGTADWKGKHPIYAKPQWRIARIKCVPGHYEPKGRA